MSIHRLHGNSLQKTPDLLLVGSLPFGWRVPTDCPSAEPAAAIVHKMRLRQLQPGVSGSWEGWKRGKLCSW